MAQSFHCLGHNTVICRNNQNYDICNLGTTSTHHSKGFVTRSIEEGNYTLVGLNLISTNLLGNSTRFTCGHIRITDCVQCFSLTVVNVSHDCNNRGTDNHVAFIHGITFNNSFIIKADKMNFTAVFRCQQGCRITVNRLVDCDHHTHRHEFSDDFTGFKVHLAGKVRYGN